VTKHHCIGPADIGRLWNSINDSGETPLHSACQNREIVELLLDRGANVEANNNHGMTPLHVTARDNCLDVAELLLDRGANLEARNDDGNTPLHMACVKGSLELVRLLLDRGADLESRNNAIETDDDDDDDDNDNENRGAAPLHIACVSDNLELIRLLLDRGADLEARNICTGATPLHEAVWDYEDGGSLEASDVEPRS